MIMEELKRIHSVKTKEKIGDTVKVSGWVSSVRDHGQLLFIDLRDWYGRIQLVVDPKNKEIFETAKALGNEYVISATGTVLERAPELVNDKLETGGVEVKVESLEILNTSKVAPFPIDGDGHDIDESIRLQYRYIDLRRERIKDLMKKKHKYLLSVRNWMSENGFTEVITPLLTSTSPEGARDFVVPSRVHQGLAFVLPQAPQQYKQLLMVGGVDRYFQIAPCARDEDPRADRHAGVFYQIDIEISFPTIDEIFGVCENLIKDTYSVVSPQKRISQFPFPRISYEDSMDRFGSDKPDIRFGMELQDITEVVKDKTEFSIFNQAEYVKCIVAEGCGEWSRKDIETMEAHAKETGAKGLAYAKVTENGLESGISKFVESVSAQLIDSVGAKPGDLLFFGADKREVVNKALGVVRLRLNDVLKLTDADELAFAWITDFPFYEMDEKTGKIEFGHNPFSMPQGGMAAFDTDDPLTIKTHQYDLALNGFELLSGSIRNHDPEVLLKAFEVVGYGEEEVKKRFGGMYNAFQYGAPPHGGWAIGFDRIFMILADEPNIRDTYAFPKNSNGMDLLMGAPSAVPQEDLDVIGIEFKDKGDKTISAIKSLLNENKVEYEFLEHAPVRTSAEAAKIRGTKITEGAKAMVLISEEFRNKFIMVVIPADKQLDIEKVNSALKEEYRVATGDEVEKYTGIKMGGVPPFGRYIGVEVYFDESMWKKTKSAFNCGRKDRSMIMKTEDLITYAQPNKLRFDAVVS
jgi:aspartyl-tRNA synthetase